MNKADLLERISRDAGISKPQALIVVNSLIKSINSTLGKGEKVTLVGFGTFSISKRAARTGQNPQTGKIIKIGAKKVAKFKAGKQLQSKIGGGTDDTGPMKTKK
ncbi:HU family DNA-binding protein [Chitinophaga sp. RCC_12]|uniref:HU family DNA-binding protein n=1 Tax=Chitinophaga sp. RCC_12 TaxID=3239226 RepID=UPI0035257692